MNQAIGLYVHVPFCITICPYCAFYKQPYNPELADIFIDQLIQEMTIYFNHYGRLDIDSLFFGGGTPNVLKKRQFSRLMVAIRQYFNPCSTMEVTMEMNPGVHSTSKCQFFYDEGVNRVSVGAQSFNPSVLDDLERNHTVNHTHQFIEQLASVGFDNISCDVIFGHPSHDASTLDSTFDSLSNHNMSHVSLYGLTIYENTPFYARGLSIDQNQQAYQYEHIQSRLSDMGYHQYEVSNFCHDGYESTHNKKYWLFHPTIGLGAGAHSYFLNHTYANSPDIHTYLNDAHHQSPLTQGDPIDGDTYLSVRLRYKQPIQFDELSQAYPNMVNDAFKDTLHHLNRHGWIDLAPLGFSMTPKGWLLLDEIVQQLFTDHP